MLWKTVGKYKAGGIMKRINGAAGFRILGLTERGNWNIIMYVVYKWAKWRNRSWAT